MLGWLICISLVRNCCGLLMCSMILVEIIWVVVVLVRGNGL